MKYKCIIVDDEKLGRELIRSYISQFSEFEILKECSSAIEAIQICSQYSIDLMFLDINMPNISGIDLLKQQANPPETILCTAYSEYALESYDLDVMDYLLKPISLLRFSKAIGKFLEKNNRPILDNPRIPDNQPSQNYFYVKSEYKKVKIQIDSIIYVEAMEKYIKIHSENERVLTLMSMSEILSFLPSNQFKRIHRSYIINKEKVNQIEGNMVCLGKTSLPVSRANRHMIDQILQNK